MKILNSDYLNSQIIPIQNINNFKLMIVIFQNENIETIPHFHVIDCKTIGNEINAAYDFYHGIYVNHSNTIKPLDKRNLKLVQSIINKKKVWTNIVSHWYTTNIVKIHDNHKRKDNKKILKLFKELINNKHVPTLTNDYQIICN